MIQFQWWILVAALTCPAMADEWWAWTTVDWWRNDSTAASLFLGNRLDFDEGAVVQIVSPRLKHAVTPWLDAGIGTSLLNIDFPGIDGQHLQLRPELELNPHIQLTPALRLDCRNRAEWRWNEGEDPTSHRSRHRLQLTLSLPGRLQPATRAFVSNEWLLDLRGHGWTENRLVPMGLTFRLSATTDLDLFFMRISSHGNGGWTSEHVVGTHLRYRWQ